MKNSGWERCVSDLKMKSEVRPSTVTLMAALQPHLSPDLHSELSRQNRKTENSDTAIDKQTSEGVPVQNGVNSPSSNSTSQQANVVSSLDSSSLIKANPSPQGTPLHTTFSGTQNFTPSTRISALNMVGDLLRKVGVSGNSCYALFASVHGSITISGS